MQFLYAGAWLNEEGKGGIHVYRIRPENGQLEETAVYREELSAGFLCISPDKRYLYAVDEKKQWQDFILDKSCRGGKILAFAIDQETGALTFINEIESCGCNPNYLCVSPDQKWLCAVNYGTDFGADRLSVHSCRGADGRYTTAVTPDESNVILVPLGEDGALGEIQDLYAFHGEPSHYWELFQWCPHAHSVNFSPLERSAVVTERGCDLVYLFGLDEAEGRLRTAAVCSSPRGFGPRNSLFHREKKLVYVIGEVSPYLIVYEYDAGKGILRERQKLSVVEEKDLPEFGAKPRTFEEFFEVPLPSDIVMDSEKRQVYVTTRCSDTIAIFDIREDGLLERVSVNPSGGSWPRTCAPDVSGRYLYVGNQKDDQIAVFTLGTAGMKDTGLRFSLEKVSCIRTLELN